MKQPMCSRCGERPAVIFYQKMVNGEMKPESLCFKCAKELNVDLGPIKTMIEKMGISEEEFEAASEQMSQFMENIWERYINSVPYVKSLSWKQVVESTIKITELVF